jgi:hypothetical protein
MVMFHIMRPNSMSRDNRTHESHNTRTKAIVTAAAIPMAAIIGAAALLSGFLPFFSDYQQPAIAQEQNMTGTNATTTTGGRGAQSSSTCNSTQTGGGGGQNATTSPAGGATTGNQSTTSEVRMHIEEACMAAQNNDVQGVLMHLNLALNVLEASGTQGNMTSSAGSSNATTTGDAGTTAGNQTVGGPLALYGGGGGQ